MTQLIWRENKGRENKLDWHKFWFKFYIISNSYPLEVVCSGSEAQLQVSRYDSLSNTHHGLRDPKLSAVSTEKHNYFLK